MADTDFLRDLTSEDNELLREAAYEAGRARSVEAVPVLAGLLRRNNLGVQEAADAALRAIGGSETVEAMVPLLRSDDAPVRNLAMDILRAVGGEHVEPLVALVHDEDTDIRIFVADILGSTSSALALSPLCDMLLKDPEVNVRYQAAVSLGALGMPAAADCLNKAMTDEEWVQYSVIEALSKLRQASSVDALVKALDKSSDLVGSMIVDALGSMGNVKAVQVLLKRLESSPAAMRNKIVKAVMDILGPRSLNLLSQAEREDLRVYMLAALEDDDAEVQDAAVAGLASLGGEQASQAILSLAAGLDPDRDQDRLDGMVGSLAAIGMTTSLAWALEDKDWKRARSAVLVMERIGGPEACAAMMDAFWDKDLELQRLIARTLAEVGDEAAKPFFLYVIDRHEDGKVLKSALRFLNGRLEPGEADETLFKLLAHEYDDVKEAALEVCIALGGQAMTDRFRDMAGSQEPVERFMAAYALGRLNGGRHLDLLKVALEDEIPDIRKVALESVALHCGTDAEALPLVVSRLHDDDRDVRLAVVDLMGGCEHAEALPHLVAALEDEDDWVKIRAVEALAARHPGKAVGHLAAMLENPNALVAIKTVEALGTIGGSSAFKVLLDVSQSGDPELASAAENALERMQRSESGGE